MALSQRLEVRQSQALVMTPQLMQAIKLLQLSSLDLAAYVEGELERNPLLERAGEDEAGRGRATREAVSTRKRRRIRRAWTGSTPNSRPAAVPWKQGLGTELENVFPDDGGDKNAAGGDPPPALIRNGRVHGSVAGEDYNLEAFVSAETTLADHLAEQMALAISDPARPHDRPVPDRYGR